MMLEMVCENKPYKDVLILHEATRNDLLDFKINHYDKDGIISLKKKK